MTIPKAVPRDVAMVFFSSLALIGRVVFFSSGIFHPPNLFHAIFQIMIVSRFIQHMGAGLPRII
jgi:hypothetical protein